MNLLFANDDMSIIGEWYTAEKKAKIEFYECHDKVCGKIVWMQNPKDDNGRLKTDSKNPDRNKRDKSILGLNIVSGLEKTEQNKWKGGEIYNLKNGKTYSCKVTIEGDTLKLKGFLGFSVFGRTEIWIRDK